MVPWKALDTRWSKEETQGHWATSPAQNSLCRLHFRPRNRPLPDERHPQLGDVEMGHGSDDELGDTGATAGYEELAGPGSGGCAQPLRAHGWARAQTLHGNEADAAEQPDR